ncbi:MAG: hypothetical protein V3V20_11025 [Algisphaera sp.]
MRTALLSLLLLAFLLVLAFTLTGCNKALISGQNAFRAGRVADAHAIFESYARGEGKKRKNRVIALLELGATQQALGDFESSNHSFAQAEAEIDRFDRHPEVSLSTEMRALLVNLNELPYRGWDSDRIMAASLRAMNFLFLHNPNAARASFNRAYRHQKEAVGKNTKQLDQAYEASDQYAAEQGVSPWKNRSRSSRAMDDPQFSSQFNQRYDYLNKYEAYADYANPFAELLQGLYFLYFPADFGDAERARKNLERAAGMAPHNAAVVDDLNAAHDAANGTPLPPTVHVFFATGTSPRLDAFYLELPLFVVSRKVDYFAANFPTLVENNQYLTPCVIQAGTQTATAEPLADIDAVVGKDFKNRLPMIVVKSTLSAALKTTAAYAINESIRRNNTPQRSSSSQHGHGNPYYNNHYSSSNRRHNTRTHSQTGDVGEELAVLFGRLLTMGYQAATNQADRRIWSSLPKKIDYTRLPMPADGIVTFNVGQQQSAPLELDPTCSHGVWVRSIGPTAPLIIQSFPFKSLPPDVIPSSASSPTPSPAVPTPTEPSP